MLEFVKSANGVMWSYVLLFILCGTGIYFTVRLKFIQVRKFGEGCRLVFGLSSRFISATRWSVSRIMRW